MEFEGNKLTLLKRKVKHAQSGGKDEEHTSISRKTAEMQAAMDGMRKAAAGGSRVHSMREASAATTGLAASIEKEDTAHDDTPVRLAPSPTADSPRAAPAPVQSVARRAAPPMTPMHVKEAAPSWAIRWSCRECAKDCIPVRSESRCLCGHRLKEHKIVESAAADVAPRFECSSSKCACRHFFFVVAEGAWILRCRCKHKHIEHDSSAAPHRCLKLKCSCAEFDSPWVCNCGHAWNSHAQSVYKKQRAELTPSMMSGCDALPDMAVELINELDLNYRKDGSS